MVLVRLSPKNFAAIRHCGTIARKRQGHALGVTRELREVVCTARAVRKTRKALSSHSSPVAFTQVTETAH